MSKKKIDTSSWEKDEEVQNCRGCQKKFTVTRRRHHCRNCGKIFCGKCSSNKLVLAQVSAKKVRVCNECFAAESQNSTSKLFNGLDNDDL